MWHVTASEKEAESDDEAGKSEPVKPNVAKVTRPQGRLLHHFLFLSFSL